MAQFYTLEEAARVLGMSADELKLKAQHREVRAFLGGGSWQFRVVDIDELARVRGMGSDPDLSLSDLDLEVPSGSGTGSDEIDLSEFQLGVAEPKGKARPGDSSATDDDILLDDMNLPPSAESSSSSTIIGMKPKGKRPSDSDVRLVPEGTAHKGASDSDVRLAPAPNRGKFPSDSDVTIVNDTQGSSDEIDIPSDPGATTLRKSPLVGSSAEVHVGDTGGDSDFELTPSSVIDALQPESGSDFELTALDASDEFEATPARSPSDSDVTASEPASSGINLGKPSDSGINLSGVGGFDFSSAESIELAPLDEDTPKGPQKKPSSPYKPAGKKQDASSETALPIKGSALDPSATALPIKSKKKGEKDIFEDTDFEVDALDSGQDDRTVQLEAASDFDLDEGESASEVFALDEDDVDENAATAMGPASLVDDDEFGDAGESSSGETDSAWGDVESDEGATPSTAAVAASSGRASTGSPALTTREVNVEWPGWLVSVLGVTTVLMVLLAFVNMDLVANLYSARESKSTIGYGLISWLSGFMGGK